MKKPTVRTPKSKSTSPKLTDGPIFTVDLGRGKYKEEEFGDGRGFKITEIHWRDRFGTLMWIEAMNLSKLFGRGDVISEKGRGYVVMRVAVADHIQHINLTSVSMHTQADVDRIMAEWKAAEEARAAADAVVELRHDRKCNCRECYEKRDAMINRELDILNGKKDK